MAMNPEEILVCPNCRGKLKSGPTLVCLLCHRSYPISHGIIDLRTGVTQKGEWDLSVFEKGYEKMGYYKDEYGWAESGGYPRYVADYRYSRVKGKIIDWLKPQNDDMILDVGCGVGYFLFDIMNKYSNININMIGIDPALPNIYWLNYRVKEENKTNIIGILGDAESLPFKDGIFNAIVTSEVIEHIFDKPKAIREMYRVLKQGGRLFMSTPSRFMVRFWEGFFWLPQKIKRLFIPPKSNPNEKAVFDKPATKKQLKRYLKEAGFSIENFRQNVIMPHESYLQFFPDILVRLIIKTASFMEAHFAPLVSWAGLHYVIHAKKQ
ncbi:MAG: methyltransferase domain-containing protein [Planctomycetes bacterium]|nr:methyltransferase domain-containing protein [Planctomycetota bacterium]